MAESKIPKLAITKDSRSLSNSLLVICDEFFRKSYFEENMKRFIFISLITALCIIGYFEISLSQAEKLFWLNLSL